MITIINFSSVFEIGFALGLVLFVFSILPTREARMKKFYEDMKHLEAKTKERGKTFPASHWSIIQIVMAVYHSKVYSLFMFATISSTISFSLLLIVGFNPGAQIHWGLMVFVLIIAFVPISIGIFMELHTLPAAERQIERMIDEDNDENGTNSL